MKLVKKSGLPSCLENMIIAVSRSEFMYCRQNIVNIIKKIAKLKLFIQNVWLDCEDEESKEVLITDHSQIHPFHSSFSLSSMLIALVYLNQTEIHRHVVYVSP